MGPLSRFSPAVRERAVRMVEEHRETHASEWAAVQSVAPKLELPPRRCARWVRLAQQQLCERDLSELNRHVLSSVMGWLGTPEALAPSLNPSCPKTQTNSRLARRAVSIVIDLWRQETSLTCGMVSSLASGTSSTTGTHYSPRRYVGS